jgi:hypothetical protein
MVKFVWFVVLYLDLWEISAYTEIFKQWLTSFSMWKYWTMCETFSSRGRRIIQTHIRLGYFIFQFIRYILSTQYFVWGFGQLVWEAYIATSGAFMLLSPLKTSWWSTKEVNGTIQIAEIKWREHSLAACYKNSCVLQKMLAIIFHCISYVQQ